MGRAEANGAQREEEPSAPVRRAGRRQICEEKLRYQQSRVEQSRRFVRQRLGRRQDQAHQSEGALVLMVFAGR